MFAMTMRIKPRTHLWPRVAGRSKMEEKRNKLKANKSQDECEKKKVKTIASFLEN